MNEETVIQTYVQHQGRWFFVSTINRESSAALADGHIYAETLIWDWNPETKDRGRIVWQDEDIRGSIRIHQNLVKRLHEHGVAGLEDIP